MQLGGIFHLILQGKKSTLAKSKADPRRSAMGIELPGSKWVPGSLRPTWTPQVRKLCEIPAVSS